MSAVGAGPRYTLRSVQQMLGLSRAAVSRLIDAGFVAPTRGARNEQRFSFQDLVLLRTAHALQQARVPPRKIVRALTRLQAELPPSLPLSGLRIVADGGEVVVRDRLGPWEPASGQWRIDFDAAPSVASMAVLDSAPWAATALRGDLAVEASHAVRHESARDDAGSPASAEDWFLQGEVLEPGDPVAADQCYQRAIELAPDHVDACLNLGALWCVQGRSLQACALYERVLVQCPDEPLLHFNRGVALEDQQRPREAIACYERCLALSPQQADAHYNVARLFEQLGDRRGALRHFSAYRRLQRAP